MCVDAFVYMHAGYLYVCTGMAFLYAESLQARISYAARFICGARGRFGRKSVLCGWQRHNISKRGAAVFVCVAPHAMSGLMELDDAPYHRLFDVGLSPHAGLVFLDTTADGNQVVTHVISHERRVLPREFLWDIVFAPDGFAALVGQSGRPIRRRAH